MPWSAGDAKPQRSPSESVSLIWLIASVGNHGISAAYELFFFCSLDFSRESFSLGRGPHDVQRLDTGEVTVRIGSKVHPRISNKTARSLMSSGVQEFHVDVDTTRHDTRAQSPQTGRPSAQASHSVSRQLDGRQVLVPAFQSWHKSLLSDGRHPVGLAGLRPNRRHTNRIV